MKLRKITIIFAILIASFMLVSCSDAGVIGGADGPTEIEIADKSHIILMHGELKQQGNWDKFLKSVEKGKAAEFSVVQYTTEGDPIIDYVSYDGQKFHLKVDNSRDKWGTGEGFEATYSRLADLSEGDEVRYCLTNAPEGQNIDTDAWEIVSYRK